MTKQLFQCEECKLHYKDKETAKDCYEFCIKNKACSLEITKLSIEHKKLQEDDTK